MGHKAFHTLAAGLLVLSMAPIGVALESPLEPPIAANADVPAVPTAAPQPLDVPPALERDPLFQYALAVSRDHLTPRDAMRAFLDFHRAQGYQFPAADDDAEEEAEFYYAYPVGDANGDGADDVAFDTFCTSQDGCAGALDLADFTSCSPEHDLVMRNGRDGSTLWTRPLDRPHTVPLFGCAVELVMGTYPIAPGRSNLLVYRYEILSVVASVFHHTFIAIDSTDGSTAWTYEADGAFASVAYGGSTVRVAESMLLMPVLQVPPSAGVRTIPEATKPGLIVRSIGFILAQAAVDGNMILRDYQPKEWAQLVRLADGEKGWKVDTFQPKVDRTVVPIAFGREPFDLGAYWFSPGCCYDLTGDSVPDLVFLTFEFEPVRAADAPGGLEGFAGRMIVHDGDTGQVAWTLEIEADDKEYCGANPAPLGDVDADGASDFSLTVVYGSGPNCYTNFRGITSTRSGRNGEEFWKIERSDSRVNLLAVGDATRDGGNDLLAVWTQVNDDAAADAVNITEIKMELRVGHTGQVVWTRETEVAPIDLGIILGSLYFNGLPDFDRDLVADFPLESPEYLPDLTVVHHVTLVSGRTGTDIFNVTTVGAFALPLGLSDTNGDERDELLVLQGDLTDLWGTAYDGSDGAPLWSRRVLSINLDSATLMIPLMKVWSLELDALDHKDVFLSFTMYIIDYSTRGTRVGATATIYQQVAALEGENGTLFWAAPEIEEGDGSLLPDARTPASELYANQTRDSDATLQSTDKNPLRRVPMPVLAVGTGGASLAAAYFFLGRRWRA